MLLLLQVAREDATEAVLAIVTRSDLRDTGQYLNTEEAKSPGVEKMGQTITVEARPFMHSNEGNGQEIESKTHIPTLIGR